MAILQVVLGSISDLEAVQGSGMLDALNQVLPDQLSYEVSVCSAHRNSAELDEFVKKAIKEGTKVFIGVAGMAAALPGALAAASDMQVPVIGVPLDEHGVDSCIYMPPGVPVLIAGVGKAGLKNAAIAALQVLAIGPYDDLKVSFGRYLQDTARQPQFNIQP